MLSFAWKSTSLPIVTVVTNMSYGLWVPNYITMQSGCIWRLSFHYHQLQNDSDNTKESEKNATMVSWVPGCLCLLTIKVTWWQLGGTKEQQRKTTGYKKIIRKNRTSSETGNGVMKRHFTKSNNVILVEKSTLLWQRNVWKAALLTMQTCKYIKCIKYMQTCKYISRHGICPKNNTAIFSG